MTLQHHNSQPPVLPRVARGETDAMRMCVDRYGGLIWSLARSFCGTREDAEEATQETFIHLWKQAGKYSLTDGEEVHFVSVVCRRRLIDWLRAKKSRGSLEQVTIDAAMPRSKSDGLDSQAEAVWNELGKLPVEQQSVLVLSCVYGLTHEQIALHLKMPIGTVKSLLYRGLAALRGGLKPTPDSAVRDRKGVRS